MNVSDIISDALTYPFNNIKALILFMILGILGGIAGGGSLVGVLAGQASNNTAVAGGFGIVGLIILIIIGLLIEGYQLDIVKFGIERRNDAPGLDFVRQIINAIKLAIVGIVYYLIPAIIIAILGIFFKDWILVILIIVLGIIFGFAEFMAKCRLAKTESLGHALAVGEAIGDISRVGIINLLLTIVLIFLIMFIAFFICGFIINWNSIIGGIIFGIVFVYTTFFANRATGLLYSNV